MVMLVPVCTSKSEKLDAHVHAFQNLSSQHHRAAALMFQEVNVLSGAVLAPRFDLVLLGAILLHLSRAGSLSVWWHLSLIKSIGFD